MIKIVFVNTIYAHMSYLEDLFSGKKRGTIRDMIMPERKVAREYQKSATALQDQVSQLNEWFDTVNGRDFLDTTEGRSFKNLLDQKTQEELQTNDSKAAITGATNEAKLAGESVIMQNQGNALSSLSKYGTSYQDQMFQRYFSNALGLNQAITGANVGAQNTLIQGQQRMAQNANQLMDNISKQQQEATQLISKALI